RLHDRAGEKEKAVAAYKKYLALYPTDTSVTHEIALAHARRNDWSGAVVWCEFALKIDPDNRAAKKTLAFCLVRAGRRDEGLAAFFQIMPEAEARYNLARVLGDMNDAEASKRQLELALKADPGFTPARDLLRALAPTIAPMPKELPSVHTRISA